MPGILFFPFYGPGYRSPRKVMELRLDCSGDPMDTLPRPTAAVLDELFAAGACDAGHQPDLAGLPESRDAALATLIARLALWLQRRCGHAVSEHSVSGDSHTRRWVALIEHDDPRVGMAALQWATGLATGRAHFTADAWRTFRHGATAHALGAETRAIIAALRRRGIPFLQCERDPLAEHFRVSPRLRPNGLLVAGQGARHVVLDGSFCVSRATREQRALLQDPARRRARLRELGLRTERLPVTGRRYDLLWLVGATGAVAFGADGSREHVTDIGGGWQAVLERLAVDLGVPVLGLQVEGADPASLPPVSRAMVLDMELAPDLAAYAGDGDGATARLEAAADRLLGSLFPGDDDGRIPVAAVTGTNGKTTTSRMVARILGTAGLRPALVCSDGIYVDGREVSSGDGSAFIGHARALADPGAHSAVLETHHRGIAVRGFAFDHCDVGVCLNVTPDHLAPGEIETLEEMIRIKQGLVEQADGGVVLNGQDAGCLGMLEAIRAPRVVLFASRPGHPLPAAVPGRQVTRCCIEARDDDEWVVLDGPAGRIDVLRVDEIPAAFGGAARFNVENAQAAIACAHLLGIPMSTVREALRGFAMGYDSTPGRQNLYDHLPYRVLLDYAHNLDGITRLVEFVRRLPVSGRRLMLHAAPGDRSDESVRTLARAAAGGFDHFVCRAYPNLRGRASATEIPGILAGALIDAGVPASAVERQPDAARAIDRILELAQPGDLVVMQLSHQEFAAVHERLLGMGRDGEAGRARG